MAEVARLLVQNMREFRREMELADKARIKAGQTAVRVEVFRLKKLLAAELRKGAPGGKALEPLRVISRGARNRKPLAALAKAVRYWSRSDGGDRIFSVGFNGGTVTGQSGGERKGNQLSASWIRIAETQQEGKTFAAGEKKSGIIRQGGVLKKQRKRHAKYYFLKKSTTSFTVPRRPVIDPFWAAHQQEAGKNIVNNFNRKMAGERI